VGDSGIGVEAHIVAAGVFQQHAPSFLAHGREIGEVLFETLYRLACRGEQLDYLRVAQAVGGLSALFDLAQPVVQGIDELPAAPGVVHQVVLQERVALDHPDIAEHLVQHAGGTACAPLAAQLVEEAPGLGTQQPDDDFAIRQGGIVIRNFAQAHLAPGFGGVGGARMRQMGDRVHRKRSLPTYFVMVCNPMGLVSV
jgi:hypothetical protein